jgi:hypothetical protein
MAERRHAKLLVVVLTRSRLFRKRASLFEVESDGAAAADREGLCSPT